MAKVNFSIRIEGSKFDSFWPQFCFQKNFGPVFCIIPLPYRATTLVSSNLRPFQREMRKKSLRTYLKTKSNSRRKEQFSLVKQGKNAMKSISPRENNQFQKQKEASRRCTMSAWRRYELMDCPLEMTVRRWCTRIWASYLSRDRRRARKRFSDSPTRPMSDGMGTQKGGASSCIVWLKDWVFWWWVRYPPLNVVWVFKHVNDKLGGDRRVEWQADRRVPDSTEGIRDNIRKECWASLIRFWYHSGNISLKLKWWGCTIGAVRLHPPSIASFRVKGLNSDVLVQKRV